MKKSGMYSGYSRVANGLFEKLTTQVPDLYFGNNEKSVRVGEKVIWVDCLHESSRRVIEFYGDLYHANPKKYKSDDMINVIKKRAGDIWERDKNRLEALRGAGYDVLVIWEGDYYKDAESIFQRCLDFLAST